MVQAYERRLVLVRPDGHVVWRGDASPAQPDAVLEQVRGSLVRGSLRHTAARALGDDRAFA